MKESGIRVSLTKRVREVGEKPSPWNAVLAALFGWLYLVLGSGGIMLALTDAFQLQMEKTMVWLYVAAAGLAVTLLLAGKKWAGAGLGILVAVLAGYGIVFRTQLAAGGMDLWKRIGIRADQYFLGLPEEVPMATAGETELWFTILAVILVLVVVFGTSIFVLQKLFIPLLVMGIVDVLILLVGLIPSAASVILQLLGLLGAGVLGSCSSKQPMFAVATRVNSANGLQQEMKTQSSVVMLLAAGMCLGMVLLLLDPVYAKVEKYRDVTDAWKERIQEFRIQDWEFLSFSLTDKGSMGINGGRLGEYRAVSPKQQTDLSITSDVDYNGTVLLKGFAAGLYGGDHWEQVALQDWAHVRLGEGVWSVKTDRYIAPEYERLSRMEAEKQDGKVVLSAGIQVQLLHADQEYSYQPGFPQASRFGETMPVYGWAEGIGANVSYVTALADPFWLLGRFGQIRSQEGASGNTLLFTNGTQEISVDYESFVNEQYLQIPAQALADVEANWKQYLQEHEPQNTYQGLANLVMSYLNDHAEYSLLPGKTPEGRDFITHFLFSQQKGYCVHFATTATMLFRMAGVPARYVEGYCVEGLQAGVTTLIEDDKAHAWCEIYVSGFGWVPVDVTPGSQIARELQTGTLEDPEGMSKAEGTETAPEGTGSESMQTEEGQETTFVSEEGNEAEGTGESQNSQQTQGETAFGERPLETQPGGEIVYREDGKDMAGTSGRIGTGLAHMLLGILASVFLFFLLRMALKKRSAYLLGYRKSRMEQKNVRLAILAAYQYVAGMTREAGISVTVDTTEAAFQKAYPGVDAACLGLFQQLVKEAYFSRHEMEEGQRAVVLDFYQGLYEETLKGGEQSNQKRKDWTQGWRKFRRTYLSCYPSLKPERQRKVRSK